MSGFDYADAPVPVRADLRDAHAACWEHLRRAGTWLTGAERVAVAAETRRALGCRLCRERQEALSPSAVEGGHDSGGVLSPAWVDVVHRVRTDSSRLGRSWFGSVVPAVLGEEAYVETLAVLAQVTAVDSFCRALGLPLRPLPEPLPGAPRRRRPAGARRDLAWVATVAPGDLGPDDPPIYAGKSGANIHRALSLVPDEVVAFFALDDVHYLPDAQLRDFAREPRTISHAQIELLAARVSAINQCVY